MRSWTLFVITFALIAGLSAATWVVATHTPQLTPAQATGLVPPPRLLRDYNPGRTPDSIEEMEAALAGPARNNFIWWTYLGEMHLAAGNPDKARDAWAEGARLARIATREHLPREDRWKPWYRLAWCQMRLGNDEAAIDPFSRAAELLEAGLDPDGDGERGRRRYSDRVWDHLFLGYTHHHLGDHRRAEEAWRKGLDLFLASRPISPANYHYHAGRFLELLGDREAALRAFRAGAANHGFWETFGMDWTPALEHIRSTPEFRALRNIEPADEPVWLPEFEDAASRWADREARPRAVDG